jgi:hypothetical protein
MIGEAMDVELGMTTYCSSARQERKLVYLTYRRGKK